MFVRREIERVLPLIKDKLKLRLIRAKAGMTSRHDVLKEMSLAYATMRGIMGKDKEEFVAAARIIAEQMEDIITPTMKVACRVIDDGEVK